MIGRQELVWRSQNRDSVLVLGLDWISSAAYMNRPSTSHSASKAAVGRRAADPSPVELTNDFRVHSFFKDEGNLIASFGSFMKGSPAGFERGARSVSMWQG